MARRRTSRRRSSGRSRKKSFLSKAVAAIKELFGGAKSKKKRAPKKRRARKTVKLKPVEQRERTTSRERKAYRAPSVDVTTWTEDVETKNVNHKKTGWAKAKKPKQAKHTRNGRRQASKNTAAVKKAEQETFPHFRKYLKSKHPALIVGEQTVNKRTEAGEEKPIEEYLYRKVMHSEYDGKRRNEEVKPNPDPTDPDPMQIAKRVRHDEKSNFSKWKYPWTYEKKEKTEDPTSPK